MARRGPPWADQGSPLFSSRPRQFSRLEINNFLVTVVLSSFRFWDSTIGSDSHLNKSAPTFAPKTRTAHQQVFWL